MTLTWSPGTLGVMLQGRFVIIPSTVSTDSRGTGSKYIIRIFFLMGILVEILHLHIEYPLYTEGRDLSSLTRLGELELYKLELRSNLMECIHYPLNEWKLSTLSLEVRSPGIVTTNKLDHFH